MKSLEIVNDLIWKTQRKYDYVDLKQDKNQIKKELEEINSEFSKLNQIKESLEVLEIIRKKKIDVGFIKAMLESYSIEEALEAINDCGYRKLTMKELLKLKQWLEENENETQEN